MSRRLVSLAGAGALVTGGGCALLMPPAASTVAPQVDRIFYLLLGISAFFTLLIAGLILTYIVRYRAGSSASRKGKIRRTWPLEAIWMGIPALLALGIFGWAAVAYVDMTVPPPGGRVVYVVAKQWMWKFRHQDGREEINTLHVAVNEPVRLVMFSQDVVHSFFVPAFRVKQDLVPGRYTTTWFEATHPGTYRLQCAEYCGQGHSDMHGEVVVMTPAELARWLGPGAPTGGAEPGTPGAPDAPLALPGSMASRGRRAFDQLGCHTCHLPTARVRAPRLDGIFGEEVRFRNGQSALADEHYLRESILDPQARISAGYPSPSLMPTYKGRISEEQVQDLIEFIRSIRDGWPEEKAP